MKSSLRWFLLAALSIIAAVLPLNVSLEAGQVALPTVTRTEVSCVTCWPKLGWVCTNGIRKDDDHCDTATPLCVE